MKPTSNTLIARSSFFLVGVATAIFVLQFLARELIPFPFVSDTDTLATGEHLRIWILIGLGECKTLAILLLATWVGQLLQHRFPEPSKVAKWILCSIAIISLALFVYGLQTKWLPVRFFGGCLVAALIQGYLTKADTSSQRRTGELVLTCVAFALLLIGLHYLERHRWFWIFAMMPFCYYMLRLSYDSTIQRLMEKPWVWPTVIVLSILSLICSLYFLVRYIWSGPLLYDVLVPIWVVVLQPAVVYPFILRWQKKHTCQVEQS